MKKSRRACTLAPERFDGEINPRSSFSNLGFVLLSWTRSGSIGNLKMDGKLSSAAPAGFQFQPAAFLLRPFLLPL